MFTKNELKVMADLFRVASSVFSTRLNNHCELEVDEENLKLVQKISTQPDTEGVVTVVASKTIIMDYSKLMKYFADSCERAAKNYGMHSRS